MSPSEYKDMIKGIFEEPKKVTKEEAEKVKGNIPFKDNEQFKLYVRRVIYFKGNSMNGITKNKILNLIYNFNKRREDLDAIMPEVLATLAEINLGDKIVKGRITTKGDGVRGLLGNGPVKFYFNEIR
jgi:hypothetical protein